MVKESQETMVQNDESVDMIESTTLVDDNNDKLNNESEATDEPNVFPIVRSDPNEVMASGRESDSIVLSSSGKETLQMHLSTHVKGKTKRKVNKRFNYKQCKFATNLTTSFKVHIRFHCHEKSIQRKVQRNPENELYDCKCCTQKFGLFRVLCKHMKAHKNNQYLHLRSVQA